MRCETCGAPAVLLENACVFCRTPVADSHAPADLLDYLAARLPAAQVKRFGLRGRGPVREFKLTAGAGVFSAKVARGRLQLTPDLAPARWVDRLVAALTVDAAGDARLRADLSRAGWKLRQSAAAKGSGGSPAPLP
jgi:hypothetical protein